MFYTHPCQPCVRCCFCILDFCAGLKKGSSIDGLKKGSSMLQMLTVNIFFDSYLISVKSQHSSTQSFFTQTCDSCLICLCVMLASLRKGSPFIHRNHIAANQVQPLCRIDHISWPSLQASSCFPDISLPTSFQYLLFSGCLFHFKNRRTLKTENDTAR